MTTINTDWNDILQGEFNKPYFKELMKFVDEEYDTKTVYPPKEEIFNALNYTSYKDVKVVILGQDPYHGYNQAHGLSFSVKDSVKTPPSLVNIYKELKQENLIDDIPTTGNLESWAKQGILLLNAVLTVRESEPNSHKNKGWETLTDKIISSLSDRNEPVVFLLWGNYARAKKSIINDKHYVLEAAHPSPLSASRGFFGCDHFIKTNKILKELNKKEINWNI